LVRGLYTAALGMMTQMKRMDIVSNNIANCDTTGFKTDTAITQTFSDELTKKLDDPKYELIKHSNPIGDMNLGIFVNEIVTDFSTGSFKTTNEKFNLAISGEGFFAVSVIDGDGNTTEKYTRDGSFTLTPDGTLVTNTGYIVLGEGGAINIENGDFKVDPNGRVYSNGNYVDRLRIVDFENKDSLRKYGDNLYDSIEESQERDFTGKILSGILESSNVNIVKEMVKMITISRNYEANQKMVQTSDSTLSRAVNDIGKKA